MLKLKKHIPNAITCGNLLCGCLAVVSVFKGDLIWSSYLVGIAAILDFFDGFVARLLKVHSEIGKQLDSLADMVTFGFVPGAMMFQLIQYSISSIPVDQPKKLAYIAFLIPVFSAIRLAKFNIDTRQTNSFIGVPTPANAILICSLPLILIQIVPDMVISNGNVTSVYRTIHNLIINPYCLIGLTIVMSYLLVAELPLFALKFKDFSWQNNKIRYSFLIISSILLILFQFIAIPIIIFLYIILSVANNNLIKTSSNK